MEPIIVAQTYAVSREAVWQAITLQEQMVQWFFKEIEGFEPITGFETRFNVRVGNKDFVHLWEVTEVVHLAKLVYNWKYEGFAGDSYVVFTLQESNKATTLKLTHVRTEDFPGDIEEFSRESGVAGWKYFIQDSLKSFLEPMS